MMRASSVAEATARAIVTAVGRLRQEPLTKPPGVAEAIDWAEAATAAGENRRAVAGRVPPRDRRGDEGRGGSRLHRAAARRHHRGDRGMTAPALPRAARPLLDFIALLRRNGFPVAPEQGLAFLRAIELLGPRDIEDIRRAGVATLAPPFERQPDFDMLFDMHFLGLAGVLSDQVAESDEELEVQDDGAGYDAPLSDDINETGQAATASEALSRRALRPDDDSQQLARFSRHLPARLPRRRGYRMRSRQARRRLRPAALAAGRHPYRWRGHPAAPPRTPVAATRHPAADRRVGLDEGALRRASALCPCAGQRRAARRGVHVRHAADAADPRAAAEEPRAGACRRSRPRGRLGRRHADRRCAGRLPRGAALRRLCPRRAGAGAVRRARARRSGADDPRGRASRRARLADRLADAACRRGRLSPGDRGAARGAADARQRRQWRDRRSGCAGTFSTCRDGGPPDDSACARLRRCPSSYLAAAGSALAARADAAADLRALRADPPRLHHRGVSGGCRRRRRHAVGLRAGELGEGALPRRGPLCQRRCAAKPAGRTPSSPMRISLAADVRPQLERLAAFPLVRGVRMQLHWHDNPQYRFAVGSGSGARSDAPAQHRAT